MPDTLPVVVRVADAVVDALNAAELSFGFEARRAYVPVFELADLATLRVSVVPAELSATALDRSPRHAFDVAVDVGIQRRVSDPEGRPDEVDALMAFAQEVVDLLRGRTLDLGGDDGARAHTVGVANAPIFDPGHLDEKRVFTSVVTLTYRVFR